MVSLIDITSDSTAMTIEFLRARLFSERTVSKAANGRANQPAKRVSRNFCYIFSRLICFLCLVMFSVQVMELKSGMSSLYQRFNSGYQVIVLSNIP